MKGNKFHMCLKILEEMCTFFSKCHVPARVNVSHSIVESLMLEKLQNYLQNHQVQTWIKCHRLNHSTECHHTETFLEHLQGWWSQQLLGQLLPPLTTLSIKKFFLISDLNLSDFTLLFLAAIFRCESVNKKYSSLHSAKKLCSEIFFSHQSNWTQVRIVYADGQTGREMDG